MTTTRQDDRKKAALARRREAEAWTLSAGLPLDAPLASVGVVIEHPGLSQCNFFLLRSMNAFSLESLGVDVTLFVLQQTHPIGLLTFPVMDSHALASWRHPLIAVGTTACTEALRSRASRIIHYVFEADFLDRRDLATAEVQRTFRDPRVTVMTRNEDYRRLIETEFGRPVRLPFVHDCEFDRMVRVLLGGE